jgi:hypothetical protein
MGRRDRFPGQGTAKHPLLSDPSLVLRMPLSIAEVNAILVSTSRWVTER